MESTSAPAKQYLPSEILHKRYRINKPRLQAHVTKPKDLVGPNDSDDTHTHTHT
jgi:hypothetical protein